MICKRKIKPLLFVLVFSLFLCLLQNLPMMAKAEENKKTVLSSASLSFLDKKVLRNALAKNTAYELNPVLKDSEGVVCTDKYYLYYEVLNRKGEISSSATIENGFFKATACAGYTIRLLCFYNKKSCEAWLADPVKYEKKVLKIVSLPVTVTTKKYTEYEETVSGYNLCLPSKYFLAEQDETKKGMICSVNTMFGGIPAVSNIHITVNQTSGEPSFELLRQSMSQAFTKSHLQSQWMDAYPAKSCYIGNLTKKTVTLGGKKVYEITYDVVLKKIKFEFPESVDLVIERLEFHNTLYTWYDGAEHISVNVIDAYESLQPNVTEAARRLVEKFEKTEE